MNVIDDPTQARWTVLHEVPSSKKGVYVLARCTCGTEREVLRTRISTGRSNCCGCQKAKSTRQRFDALIRVGRPDECWEWQGVRNQNNYGKFGIKGRMELAHRMSYLIHIGPIPDGLLIRHACDNPPCVNPRHLSTGTAWDNSQDALDRGRFRLGVDSPAAKLTEDDVRSIRSRSSAGRTQADLASEFNVSRTTISNIVNRRLWKHVKDVA